MAPGAPLTVSSTAAAQLRRRLDAERRRGRRVRQLVRDAGARARRAAAASRAQRRATETHAPRARFTVTRPAGADFPPASGDPRTLRARFTRVGLRARDAGGDPACGCTGSARRERAPERRARHDRRATAARSRRRRDGSSRSRPRPAVGRSRSTRIAATACRRTAHARRSRARPLAPPLKPMRRLLPFTLLAAAPACSPLGTGAAPGRRDESEDRARPGLLPQQRHRPADRERLQTGQHVDGEAGRHEADRHGRIDPRGRSARASRRRDTTARGDARVTLSVTDGPHVASTTFLMTPLDASFSPRTGDPASCASSGACWASASAAACTCTTWARTAS